MGVRFPVEYGQVLAFNRSIGVSDTADDVVVPPTFTACSIQHDPVHMRGLQPTGALATVDPGAGQVLHAEQRFEYFAPLHVGAVLEVAEHIGRRWTKHSRSGGELLFTELVKEVRGAAGELIVRSTMVLVVTQGQP